MEWRIIGLVSLVVILVAGSWPLRRGVRGHGSVSQSWSVSPDERRWLAPTLSLAGAGACAGIAGWLMPHYGLPGFLYGVVALAFVAMQAVAWVPLTERPGEHSLWHGHFLGGAGLATLAVVALVTIAVAESRVPGVVRWLAGVGALTAASWPLWYISRLRRYFVVAEIVIAGLFCAVVIWLFMVAN